jgi:hypothetical protein
MAQVRAPSGADRDAHANDAPHQARRRTVAAPVSATPCVLSQSLCTPVMSESSGRRISMPASDGIHPGGRRPRLLTGLLECGLCSAQLRASPRSRHETRWRPVPGSKMNDPYAFQWSQPRYVCRRGHLAIVAQPLEQLIKTAVAADRPGETLAAAITRIVVAPGRPGCNHFDPYRLHIVWRDPAIRTTPLRRLYDQAGGPALALG